MLGVRTITGAVCTVWYICMLVLYSTEYGCFKNIMASSSKQEYLSLPNKTGDINDIIYYI